MDGNEMMADARKRNPSIPAMDFKLSDRGDALGLWNEDAGRYLTIAGLTILDGSWMATADFYVNGKPAFTYATKRVPLREMRLSAF